MNEHILNLITQRQYSEEVKDEAILRVLFNGESAIDVAEAMDIHNVQTINLWVNAYRRKIQEGLITFVQRSAEHGTNEVFSGRYFSLILVK